MLRLSVFTFISLHPFLNPPCVAARPSRHEASAWISGCVNASETSVLGLFTPVGRDLDPTTCAALCLEQGFQTAALTSESCCCSSLELHELAFSECLNTSSRGDSEDDTQSCLPLPLGGGQGTVALYRTEGPFLSSIAVSTRPGGAQAGKTFIVEVYGKLAGPPAQPTGIEEVGGLNLSHVTVDLWDMTSQRSHHVKVSSDGSFVVTSDWIFESPGKYEINVRVFHPLSTLSSSIHLSLSQSRPDHSVLHGPLSVPSCVLVPQTDLCTVAMHKAFLSEPVTVQDRLAEGLAAGICWRFTEERSDKDLKTSVWTACFAGFDCLNSTVTVSGSELRLSAGGASIKATFDRKREDSTNQDVSSCTDGNARIKINDHLAASVLSPTHPSSALFSTFLHQNSVLCEHICVLRPLERWMSVHPTHADFSLDVVSYTKSKDSREAWTFSMVIAVAVVVNRTTEGWNVIVCFPKAGCYKTTVEAFKPFSQTSFHTHIFVQDPDGKPVLNTPSVTTTNQNLALLFSIGAESNVAVSLLVNATALYRNSSYAKGEEAEVVLLFNHTGTVAVELRAETRVSSQNKSVTVCIKGNRKQSPQVKVNPNWQPPTSAFLSLADTAVTIYAAKQAYPTDADVTLMVLADVQVPVEFIWHFGDSSKSVRTTSRTVTKRYSKPGSFGVVVVMSSGQTSVTSRMFPLEIQRPVKLNRLVHPAAVLQNRTLTVSCRVNAGTNLTFLWSFGDGSHRLGRSTEQHVFYRTGEVGIDVTVSNLVSSASLSSLIFVVDRPCQPPPVKNMGPLQVQVWRYERIRLGVTYENDIDCDLPGGLRYTWALFDSAGQIVPLPSINTHRQGLLLPGHLLHYDTYTAVARAQVIGSVVYSNYSVRVKVLPSPLVAFIQGGTNIFINNRNSTLVSLDGRRSFDPDFPLKPLSYSWTCKPVSSISSSCFHQRIPTSSPVLTFPVGFLKHNFDQFQFTLTIHSGEHSASSDTFLTVTPNVFRKVLVYCPQCRGDQVSWDQPFSVSALCEDCDVPPERIQYSWRLYSVNASTGPVTEAALCHTVDLSAPSTVMEDGAAWPQAPSAVHAVNYTLDLTPVALSDSSSRTRTNNKHVDRSDGGTTSNKNRSSSNKDGEELLHRPLGEHRRSTETPPLALDDDGFLYLDHLGDVFSEFPDDSDSSADWEFSFPVLEAEDAGGRPDSDYGAEKGGPGISAGRPTGADGPTFHLHDDSVEDSELHGDGGSDLVDSRPPVVIQGKTLLDLHRDPVDRRIFDSYTYTGTSSSLLSFRAFSLRPGSRYMLEVTAKSRDNLLGRTQLFLKTEPAPKEVTCQVQPVEGSELHTQFSIFCSSGKEDLLYKYSFRVGGNPPRMLYQGRDFQYYFRLPSGDPSDEYKVTIYTEIQSAYGTATKPCPVTVQVQPSFLRESSPPHRDPALELLESGLRNLSALVRLGNSMEIRNYVSLLSSILNRLSLDAEASAHTQAQMRSALICTLCELESSEQQSMEDNICVLKDVVKITDLVSFASARRVAVHIQAISDQILESRAPIQYNLDYNTLTNLITLLSHTLQAAANGHRATLETPHSVAKTQALGLNSRRRRTTAAPHGCIQESRRGVHTGKGEWVLAEHVAQLVADIHGIASDLMLKYILFHEAHGLNVSTGFVTFYVRYQNSTVSSGGSTTFRLPVSLIQQLYDRISGENANKRHPPCLLSVLTEFSYSPYTWASFPTKLNGPVVSLNLYQCGSRRKIHTHSFIQPFSVELQQPRRNMSSVHAFVLSHDKVNYHSFNITQEHLLRAIQFSVVFKPLSDKVFPVTLLFRMFDRPTPSMHHLHRIHSWESDVARITLPPSYLNAEGVAHLALLNAGKAPKHKHLSEQIAYSLTADSSLCLSWDGHQRDWTHHGCRTQQADTATVCCSCHQLRPLTVVQSHLDGSFDTADLDLFMSASSDLTVPGVLVLFVCLYILGLVLCRKSVVISEQGHPVHYLPDNSPLDPYLYAVTIHTGLRSAARMSAKVYIVLYGEDGVSQTRELHIPGCTLFRRNCHDTFILSTAHSLGPVRGVHIWHDNSGHAPNWYLKRVEVSEVDGEHGERRAWLFVGQCWLAVNKGDGQVEKKLRACTQGMGFTKMLCLKLCDYLADFHIWISAFSCPYPNNFTHAQRLTVCLLLLLGYACVNTVMISQMDNQLPLELGITDISAVSVTTGVLSVLAALPAATVISFLFRWREIRLKGSGVQHVKGRGTHKDNVEDDLSVNERIPVPQQQTQGDWQKKYQGTNLPSVSTTNLENKDTHDIPDIQPDVTLRKEDALQCGISMGPVLQNVLVITEEKSSDQGKEMKTLEKGTHNGNHVIRIEKESQEMCLWKACSGHSISDKLGGTSQWCQYVAWMLCLLLSLFCMVLSTVLGMRFASSKVLLWIHSLFFSLISCIFLIHPVLIFMAAVMISLWYRNRPDFHSFSEVSKALGCKGAYRTKEQFSSSNSPQKTSSYYEELLRARQRARYLRLVHPPTPAELRKIRGKRRRETVLWNNIRDLSVCVPMLCLVLCMTYGSSFHDRYHLNKSVRNRFTSNHNNAFMSVTKHEDWWKWMQTHLLDALYKNVSAETESYILIGEPMLWKMEAPRSFQSRVSGINITPLFLHSFLLRSGAVSYLHPSVETPRPASLSLCDHLHCYSAPNVTVGLGLTKSDAASKLKHLHSSGWLGRDTLTLKVQFTLYSPAPNLFTGVTLLTELSPTGVLRPSAEIQSVRVYHTPDAWDYVAVTCQLLFLLLSLLQLCHQVDMVAQRGLMKYCRIPYNWLEAVLLTVSLVCYLYYIYHSVITAEVVELLQRRGYKGHVDVSPLAKCEQCIRSARGVTLFLLTVKCVTLLRVNGTMAPSAALLSRSFSSLFWPMTLLLCYWGLRRLRGLLPSRCEFLDGGVLYLFFTVVCTAAMMSVMTSIIKRFRRRRGRRTPVFTAAEMVDCVRNFFFPITLQRNPTWSNNDMKGRTYYLEEFESLADELLFKISALSNSLHHTLHPRAHCYMEEHPVPSPVQEVSSVDAEDIVRVEMIEETKKTDHTEFPGHGTIPSTSHMLRSKLKLKILRLLQQKNQSKNISSQIAVTPDNQQHPGTKSGQIPHDGELQTFSGSASLTGEWTEDVLEKRVNQYAEMQKNCWIKPQVTHAEVVVEALVHQKPQSVGSKTVGSL